jgi:hypothetical protein
LYLEEGEALLAGLEQADAERKGLDPLVRDERHEDAQRHVEVLLDAERHSSDD